MPRGQLKDFERIWEQVSSKMDLNPTEFEEVGDKHAVTDQGIS
jgi:hypothetical protein